MHQASLFIALFGLIIRMGSSELVCKIPQKYLFVSYHAMSKRDTLPNLFEQINTQIEATNSTYTDNATDTEYQIIDFYPQLDYNEHHQLELYEDTYHIRVKLGAIEMKFHINYTITRNETTEFGWGSGRVQLQDGSYFIKQLMSVDGKLLWNPTEVSQLKLVLTLSLEHTEPKVLSTDKSILQSMLNDINGDQRLKQTAITEFNSQYKTYLKLYLNNQTIISDTSLNYQYQTITYTYLNVHRNYTISRDNSKGLEISFFFELENHTTTCTDHSPVIKQSSYGGLQEFISMTSIRNTFIYSLSNKLYDVTLDRQWEVPGFQFYMGDLSNAINYAFNFSPDDSFTVTCKWDGDEKTVVMSRFSQNQIYTEARQICQIVYQQKPVLQMKFALALIAEVIAQDKSLLVKVNKIFKTTVEFNSIDPNYVVSNRELADWYIRCVIEKLIGQKVVGSGWETVYRRFPSVMVGLDYLIIFDLSQI